MENSRFALDVISWKAWANSWSMCLRDLGCSKWQYDVTFHAERSRETF